MVSSTPRPHFTPGKEPVPILQEAGWAPGPVWTGGKSRPHRDSIPDRPARSQSLYLLSYPARVPTFNTENPSLLGCDATVLDYLTLNMRALRSFETCELFAQRLSNTAVRNVKDSTSVLSFRVVFKATRTALALFARFLLKSDFMYCVLPEIIHRII